MQTQPGKIQCFDSAGRWQLCPPTNSIWEEGDSYGGSHPSDTTFAKALKQLVTPTHTLPTYTINCHGVAIIPCVEYIAKQLRVDVRAEGYQSGLHDGTTQTSEMFSRLSESWVTVNARAEKDRDVARQQRNGFEAASFFLLVLIVVLIGKIVSVCGDRTKYLNQIQDVPKPVPALPKRTFKVFRKSAAGDGFAPDPTIIKADSLELISYHYAFTLDGSVIAIFSTDDYSSVEEVEA